MHYREIKKDLFDVPSKYYLAHCINGSYNLGAGIAKTFRDRLFMQSKLRSMYTIEEGGQAKYIGKALLVGNVFNLVTKAFHYSKPTYESLYSALKDMRDQCEHHGIKYLAMPKIGCGLDRLDWDKVSAMVKEVFSDLDIDILVCYL
jgi:O-acetyl-ADP-ribose deacetylase (regulator of RNase III)